MSGVFGPKKLTFPLFSSGMIFERTGKPSLTCSVTLLAECRKAVSKSQPMAVPLTPSTRRGASAMSVMSRLPLTPAR